jgi:hydroxyethylthiazole kinase-like uncharacterized protein yjeF
MHEILTSSEMARVDARAEVLGATTRSLMENAGRAVVSAVVARWSPRPVLVLCGSGNNGGDGYVAARALVEAGWPVRVAALAPPRTGGAAADAAMAWAGPVETLGRESVRLDDLVIDALFGAGLDRPLVGVAAAVVEALAADRVVAVDIPSGVTGEGAVPGPAARAALTVTFCRKKPAHVLYPARARCGEIVLADISIPEQAVAEVGAQCWENTPALWRIPWPDAETHKHRRGRLAVASGGPANTGAARLAARAALRAGAGLVTVMSPPNALLVNAAHLTAIMLAPFADAQSLAQHCEKTDVVVIGPAFGLGQPTRDAIAALAALRNTLVLDADALTSFADDPDALFALFALCHERCVLTPHAGEFARLFPDLSAPSLSKLDAAREAARRAGCVVLYKGPDTVIASPDGRAAINTNATPFLATAGAGDVLAGIIAGLAGQGMMPWEAACAACYLHGACGALLGPGLIAEDLCEVLPRVLSALKDK